MTWSFCPLCWPVAWVACSEAAGAKRIPPKTNRRNRWTRRSRIERSINHSRSNRKLRSDRNGPEARRLVILVCDVDGLTNRSLSLLGNLAGSAFDGSLSDLRLETVILEQLADPIRLEPLGYLDPVVKLPSRVHQCCKSSTARFPSRSGRPGRGIWPPCRS